MPGEKRSAKRKTLRYPARIVAGDGKLLCDCVLSDVSESGARVVLYKPNDIPERFTLLMGTQGAAPRQCRVVWRAGAELGLEFQRDAKPAKPPMSPSQRDR